MGYKLTGYGLDTAVYLLGLVKVLVVLAGLWNLNLIKIVN